MIVIVNGVPTSTCLKSDWDGTFLRHTGDMIKHAQMGWSRSSPLVVPVYFEQKHATPRLGVIVCFKTA
jgi:hypothetical protein